MHTNETLLLFFTANEEDRTARPSPKSSLEYPFINNTTGQINQFENNSYNQNYLYMKTKKSNQKGVTSYKYLLKPAFKNRFSNYIELFWSTHLVNIKQVEKLIDDMEM